MKFLVWLLILGAFGALGYTLWKWRERWTQHKRASEERLAIFIAQAKPAVPAAAAVDPSLPQQRLLFEAALKAGEAGEAAISVQLYGRLLERYPQTAFGEQAQAAIEQQKRKLANP